MSALTAPSPAALANLRAWFERVMAETISDDRLKASLIAEALERYGVASATLARAAGLDACALAAFLATRIAPGEVFEFETEGGLLTAPYLTYSKIARQLRAEKTAFGITYRGAMGDEWLTRHLAVMLTRNGIEDILEFASRNFSFTFAAGSPMQREMREVGDGGLEWTGRYLYPIRSMIEIDPFDYAHLGAFVVDPAFLDENGVLKTTQTVDSGIVDYYYNTRTGQRLDAFSDQRGRTLAYDPTGAGTTIFQVQFTREGTPVFVSQLAFEESTWQIIAPVVAVVVMAATAGGAGPWLGATVLGAETAAAYPVIADAIGRLALATVATGGDVAGSVAKLVSTLAGGYFGDVLGTGLDSAALGTVAGSVATAAINGDDVRAAALQSLARIGISHMDTFATDSTFDSPADGFDGFDAIGGTDFAFNSVDLVSLADIGIDPVAFDYSQWMSDSEPALFAQGLALDSLVADSSGNLFLADGQFVELSPDVYPRSVYVDDAGNVRGPDNGLIVDAASAATMSEQELAAAIYQDWERGQGTMVNSMQAAPGRPETIPPAAGQTKVPAIVDYAKAFETVLNVAVSAYTKIRQIAGGTYRPIAASYPAGMPRVQAVGVPVTQADGSTITNNGNGTQTVRRADGTASIISASYSGAGSGSLFSGVNTQTLLIGGAALIGALLIAKRR